MIKKGLLLMIGALMGVVYADNAFSSQQISLEQNTGCLTCHQGIEPIRDPNSEMMKQIFAKGKAVGDDAGCVVCHGGNPNETENKLLAHQGAPKGNKLDFFTPVPGALNVVDKTCGMCHQDHAYNVHRSMMNTDAGKIQALAWSWGINTDTHKPVWSNMEIEDPDGLTPRFGTETYKAYMEEFAKAYPDHFPLKLDELPNITSEDVEKDPTSAVFSYLRNCNKCHVSNKGLQDRGHFRGDGCASCHILYGNDGYYVGGDNAIDKTKAGRPMVHQIQGTRKSKLTVNGHTVSGIQVTTCASCHAGGRRIGYSYQGMMPLEDSNDQAPFNAKGEGLKTHGGYTYKYVQDDAHHRVSKDGKTVQGLLCQDCHLSTDIHGNGNIGTATLADIEIECSDCHGTPQQFPWELPIGFGDEFGKKMDAKGRGLANAPMMVTKAFATTYPAKDGYLISARGNPMGNVVKDGKDVIVHSASGLDFKVPVLKQLNLDNSWTHPEKARVAMVGVSKHMEKLDCYACHSTWAPQYYGSYYVLDYRKQMQDWVAVDKAPYIDKEGKTADHNPANIPMIDGYSPKFDYDNIRIERPPLVVNGEGRVVPAVGVIQTVATVIDSKGNTLLDNYVAKTKAGYSAMDVSPIQPHSNTKNARDCMDCHGSSMAGGYGEDFGLHNGNPEKAKFIEPITAEGKFLTDNPEPQIPAVPNLNHSFTQIIDKDGKQLMTVDSHWATSSPLKPEQLAKLDRQDTCIACHQSMPNMPDASKAMTMLGYVAKVFSLSFADGNAHKLLLDENNLIVAWFKALGIIFGILGVGALIAYFVWRKPINQALKRAFKALFNRN